MLHSKQWHYSLHRDFQNCHSTRRSPTGFFSSNSTSVPIHHTTSIHIHHYMHPENSPSRIQFYMQKTKSSSSTTTTYRRQRDLHSRKEILCIEGKEIFYKFIRVSYKIFQRHSRHSSLSRHSRHSSRSRPSSHFGHSSHS